MTPILRMALVGLMTTTLSSFAKDKTAPVASVVATPVVAPVTVTINSDADKMGYFLGQEFSKEMTSKWDANTQKAIEQGISDSQDSTKKAYLLGLQMGVNLKALNERLAPLNEKMNNAVVLQGIKDRLEAKPALVTEDSARAAQQRLGQKAFELEKQKKMAEEELAKKASDEFLAKNKQKPGVQATASGLQYEVLTVGKGIKASAIDTVEVHYKGTLTDGKVFDESYTRGQPVSFALNQVIPGWIEGIQLMNEGSKFKFVIPSALGYGEQGAGNAIPANAVLVFEVELLKVKKAVVAPAATEKKAETKKDSKKKK